MPSPGYRGASHLRDGLSISVADRIKQLEDRRRSVNSGLAGAAGRQMGSQLKSFFSNLKLQQPQAPGADLNSLLAQYGSGGGQSETRTTSRSSGPFQWAGPSDSDFDSYAQRVIAQLNPAYDNAIASAGQQKGRAGTEIGAAHADALASYGRANADYQRQAQALDAQVGQYTDSAKLQALGDAAAVYRDLAAQGQAMGQANGVADSGAGLANVAQFAAVDAGNVLDTQAGLQRALGARLNEVQAQQQQDTRNSTDQVKQVATGTLENNYSDILNRIQADRAKAAAAVTQEAERMKMDNRMAYANALAQHNASNGTTTETVYGGGSSDPIERMLQLQQVAANQQELSKGGSQGFMAPQQALPQIAGGYLAANEGDANLAVAQLYADVQAGAMTPDDFQRVYQYIVGG